MELFKRQCGAIDAIVHTASQPSHDWGPRRQTDFTVSILFAVVWLWRRDAIVNGVCVEHHRNQVEEK